MGLFGNDEQQDQRLDSLEKHVRQISQLVQQNQMDITSLNLDVLSLNSQLSDLNKQLGEKLSVKELDPAFDVINSQIKEAREELKRVNEAATEAWEPLQAGVSQSIARLREEVVQLKSGE